MCVKIEILQRIRTGKIKTQKPKPANPYTDEYTMFGCIECNFSLLSEKLLIVMTSATQTLYEVMNKVVIVGILRLRNAGE